MPARPEPQLPIRTISSLTGVNAITLRAWERRYGLIRPLRTASGHRLYTHEHVELIRRVLALTGQGVPVGRVREMLDAEPPTPAVSPARGPWRDYLDRMTAAIGRFDEPELDQTYDEVLSLHPVENLTRRVLLPLLARLGARWQTVSGAVAKEHFFSTYLRSKLGARLQHRMRYAAGPRLVAACAPGEQHEIGLLLFALEAQAAGFRTVILGTDTPLVEIGLAARRGRCDGAVVASSVDPAPGLLERALPELVKRAGAPVFIGGTTAERHRRAVAAAGAIALGRDLEDSVRLIAATLAKKASGS